MVHCAERAELFLCRDRGPRDSGGVALPKADHRLAE